MIYAVVDIDEIIALIKSSKTREKAIQKLMQRRFSIPAGHPTAPMIPARLMKMVRDADELRQLGELLHRIDEREAKILKLRYGLDGSDPMTLKEIGERIGLTRERVRQIEHEALRKLRDSMMARAS